MNIEADGKSKQRIPASGYSSPKFSGKYAKLGVPHRGMEAGPHEHWTGCLSNILEPKILLHFPTLCTEREGFERNTTRSRDND